MKKGKFNKWIILVALLLVLVIVWVLVGPMSRFSTS